MRRSLYIGAWFVAVTVTASASGSVGQSSTLAAQYKAAVAGYSSGTPIDSVVAPMRGWTRDEFDKVVVELAREPQAVREAAAALQMELTLAFVTAGLSEVAVLHAQYGGQFITAAPEGRGRRTLTPEAAAFAARYFGAVASAFLSISDGARAEPFLERGLNYDLSSARLRTQLGAARELRAAVPLIDLWTVNMREPRSIAWARRLLPVQQTYLEATQRDPTFAEGWLRLARIQFILGSIRDARSSIARARDLAAAPREKYLAALTLGAILQHDKELGAARKAYEEADAAIPNSQAAVVALAYLDVVSGRPDLAQQRSLQFAAAGSNDIAWWEFKNGGLDRDGIDWLRHRVKR
jgi:tetratricopeptide (TPR) repeat protein